MTINHPTVFARKECYENFGIFDEQYKCAMDYDLLLRFGVNGCRFVHVPEVLANMRWDGNSDSKWLLWLQRNACHQEQVFSWQESSGTISISISMSWLYSFQNSSEGLS